MWSYKREDCLVVKIELFYRTTAFSFDCRKYFVFVRCVFTFVIGLKNLVRLPELDSNSTNRDFIHSPSLVLETAGVYFELSLVPCDIFRCSD